MKNKIEYILLSVLLGLSILLGLSFWLNNFFAFNLFCQAHWEELSKLQASHMPIANGFYISIWVAISLFIFGLYIIYMPRNKKTNEKTQPVVQAAPSAPVAETKVQEPVSSPEETPVIMTRPPRLNLPKNMAQIIAQRQSQNANQQTTTQQKSNNEKPTDTYNSALAEIFSNNGYVVKSGSKISGFSPNLFAIGPNEIVWIGAVDTAPSKLNQAVDKLNDIFHTTLEDIPIHVKAFILDTLNQYQPDENTLVFKSLEELKTFVSENPSDTISDEEIESFGSYSEYIDTIIQYLKNL